jgi:dTDP-4-dehydrorhamnose reductase
MDTKYLYHRKPEVWGGIECTINRVGNSFRDQLHYAGHYRREEDIDQIASLGITKLRYPVLWEHHQPKKYATIDWRWVNQQLTRIRQHNITPIAGLLHHGSGPSYTDLLDKEFAVRLAEYAGKVATQFPWLEHYTPVNEPLTTARFSGLYGFWYPHHSDERSFFRVLINQLKAVALSMQAIRRINPEAKLIQTEDLAKTHSTSLLSYQADFENERRWLSNDLLCGKVDRHHFFWNYLIDCGISIEDLVFFLENPCPPDILGFNYYVTSERWLDEQTQNYPACTHGGNGKHIYADTEAVRAWKTEGLEVLLKEAHNRYQLPLAITECHLNCTREEQLRWIKECWDTCCKLSNEGVNVKAMTAWSLLGAFDWNSLLTEENYHYEPGIFDLQGNRLRPTAAGKLIRALATQGEYDHPLVSEKGWWHRKECKSLDRTAQSPMPNPPVMIIGKNGTLGRAFARICDQRAIAYITLSRNEIDIVNVDSIKAAIDKYKPWAIINTAGYVRVDDAELNCDECFAINATGPGLLAKCCALSGIKLMTFSSDLVFNGEKKLPYLEADGIMPLNIYGASKAEAERLTSEAFPDSLIIRTSSFFGPWDKYNFAWAVIDSLSQGKEFNMPKDVVVSPTYVPDLVHSTLDLFIDDEKGIWHVTNDGMLTWSEFAEALAERTNHSKKTLVAKSLIEMGWKAKRPLYSALDSEKGIKMPSIENALDRYIEQRVV